MDRIITLTAAIAGAFAALFSAYAAFSIHTVMSEQLSHARRVEAIAAMGDFDKSQGVTPRGLPCLRIATQIADPALVDAFHAGASFEVPTASSLKGLDQCRRRLSTTNPDEPVKFTQEDSRAMLRNSVAILGAFEQLFSGVRMGLTDCKTIESRYERTLTDDKEIYLSAIRQFEGQETALSYPAFTDYLTNGCK